MSMKDRDLRPCVRGQNCQYLKMDSETGTFYCSEDFDESDCKYRTPWGLRLFREEHPWLFLHEEVGKRRK